MATSKRETSASDEQTPIWGLPERQVVAPLRTAGSVLVVRLPPALSEALHARTEDPVIDRLVLSILHEWAGVPEEE